jgi:hypothetical protein
MKNNNQHKFSLWILVILQIFVHVEAQITATSPLPDSVAHFFPVTNEIKGYSLIPNSLIGGFSLSPSVFGNKSTNSSSLSFLFWSGLSNGNHVPNFHIFSLKSKESLISDFSSPWNYSYAPLGLMKGQPPGAMTNYASVTFSYANSSYFLMHGGYSVTNRTNIESIYTMNIGIHQINV